MIWTFGNLLTGLSSDYQDGKSKLTPESGANFEREKFTTTKEIITGKINLDLENYLLFKQFYKDTKQGADYFTYNDCVTDIDRQAKFYGNYKAQEQNGYWNINLSLILDNISYIVTIRKSYNGCPAGYNGNYIGVKTNYEL